MRIFLIYVFSFIIFLGIALLITIPYNTAEYTGHGMPASFLPNILAVSMTLCAFVELIKVIKNKDDKRPSPINIGKLFNLFKFFIVTILSMPLMELITFIPASIIVIIAYQWLLGQRDIKIMLIVSVCLSLFIYFLTTELLLIHLP